MQTQKNTASILKSDSTIPLGNGCLPGPAGTIPSHFKIIFSCFFSYGFLHTYPYMDSGSTGIIQSQVVTIIPILFVDDNRELANIFQFYLEKTGLFTVHVCLDGDDALEFLNGNEVQAIVSDYDMPEMDGITLLRQVRNLHPQLPFIMLTGNDSKEIAIEALNAGADFYQNKGEDLEIQVLDLSHKITILVEKARAEAAIQRKDRILEVIGHTAGRLLKGENFYAEMMVTLRDICQVTGAVGAFIGNPIQHGEELPGDVPNVVTWWTGEGMHNGIYPKDIRNLFSDLAIATSKHWDKDEHFILTSGTETSPSEQQVLDTLNITSVVFLPVSSGNERWGFLSLFYKESKIHLSDPELYAFSMLTKLAGAARYRAYMEEYFKNPVEKSLVGVFLIKNNRFIYINPRFSTIFGYSRTDIIRSKSLPGLFEEEDVELVMTTLSDIQSGWRENGHLEVKARHRDGSLIYLELYVTMFRCNDSPCLIGNCLDITARKEAEEKARASEELLKQNMLTSLHEKETLLREIHHRVKNNMQIIASLLRLSGFKSGNPEVHDIIRDCRNRIFSMTSIHEKLYETDDLVRVPLGSYIRDIGNRIILEFEMEEGRISYVVQEDEPVLVDINTGIPIGLIMNELITNSIKHAFPVDGKGSIEVSLSSDNGCKTIRYHDTGVGLPIDFHSKKHTSLGIELIHNLTHQIMGTVSFTSGSGMTCVLSFPVQHRVTSFS